MEIQEDRVGNDEQKEYSAVSRLLSMIGVPQKGENDSAGQRVSESDRQLRKQFLSRCYYVQGKYDQPADYQKLVHRMEEFEAKNEEKGGEREAKWEMEGVNRIFYLAIPPTEFSHAVNCIHGIRGRTGWTRIVVEKPFGEDLESAKKLNALVKDKFNDDEVYRIDHFMGKETLQNIIPLRFSNRLYSTLWSAEHISSIIVNVKEDFGLEGRAGYFDASGIVRDMIQNHLLSIVALCTMEEPEGRSHTALQKSKCDVLRSMKSIVEEDIVLGQYGSSRDGKKVGYAEDKGVNKGTKTATYVAVVVHIDNERWRGVPILMHCGKALNETKSEIQVYFKPAKSKAYSDAPANALQIRLAPTPSIVQEVNVKSPGIGEEAERKGLQLVHEGEVQLKAVPTAYERLVFDVIRGERQLFVTAEEVEAAWAVVDPVLKQLEGRGSQPVIYAFGSHGPAVADGLLRKYHFPKTIEKL